MRSAVQGAVLLRQYRGRLGNQLAQYCLARRIAEELNFLLFAPGIPGFPNTYSMTKEPPSDLATHGLLIRTGHQVDLRRLLSDREPRILELSGVFMRYEYFAPVKQSIRDTWLARPQAHKSGKNDLAIHIRSGDVYRAPDDRTPLSTEYHTLPFSFYCRVIGQERWDDITVVCADHTDPMARKISRVFGARLVTGGALDDFDLLGASRNIVLSVSSFAWWSAWLSDAHRIFYPVVGLFDHRRGERRPHAWRHDLRVLDEDRYEFVNVDGMDFDWRGTSEQRDWLLAH